MTDYKIQKPFLKWVGGKTQIIDRLFQNCQKKLIIIMNYLWEEVVFYWPYYHYKSKIKF